MGRYYLKEVVSIDIFDLYNELIKNNNRFQWTQCVGISFSVLFNNVEYRFDIIEYLKNGHKLTLRYNDIVFKITSNDLIKFKIKKALKLPTLKRNTHDYFIKTLKEKNIKIIPLETYIKSNDKILFLGECGHEWKATPASILKGSGCPYCSGHKVLEGFNDLATTHPDVCVYFVDKNLTTKISVGHKNKVAIRCPDCKKIKYIQINNFIKNGLGCNCGDGFSYPEKFMYNILMELNIDFQTQYSPDWIKPKRYDFYIESLNLIIEMDGNLGHGIGSHPYSKNTKQDDIKNDKYKDYMAEINSIKLIRIKCEKSECELIKNNIIQSELSNIFNIAKIDWYKVDLLSQSNFAKKICDMWKNEDKTISEICYEQKIDKTTASKYLKIGNKFGWCEYDIETQKRMGVKVMNKNNEKPICVFYNDIFIKRYETGKELSEKSEKDFGFKIHRSTISKICNNKIKKYKGYCFVFGLKED